MKKKRSYWPGIGVLLVVLCGLCGVLTLGPRKNGANTSAPAALSPREESQTQTASAPVVQATAILADQAPQATATEIEVSPTAIRNTATAKPSATQPPTLEPSPTVRKPQPTQAPPTNPPIDTPVIVATDIPVVQATATAPRASGFTLLSLTSPIAAGATAHLSIQTAPNAVCTLSYTTPAGTDSTAGGLGQTTADGNGVCSWAWEISGRTKAGTGRIFVTADGVSQGFDIVIQ